MASLAERIEALIAARSLKPGDRMPAERSLAAEFQVSRSSLREAIQQLVSRGLLISRHGGGTFVAAPDEAEPVRTALLPLVSLAQSEAGYWRDVMEIRKLLDSDTASFAALRADEADKARLVSAYQAVANAPADDPETQARADAAFHMAIAQAAHNAVLHQIMAGLHGLLEISISDSLRRLYDLPGILDLLNQQHRQILDCILAGNAEAARQAAADHLTFVESRLRLIEDSATRQRRSSRALQHIAEEKEALS
ncbi:FCD domain-containing protein [Kaistia dalseonensis]|uniref:GntR family L-lactate dehydrogenase operon transcriptional regulator n=1 Tax=Kaistia dalseonensis TaxID=410840 RepID=A0ABU0H346_9HYPH|nr:FCD domain-containing protein [Kaistia dalseonensis]MCX5493339.1 FCD domain-containing protein [Kaistia dalseonensis]MDQ0435896.1 GntR family L-lactate dehydrogenase operon transcriptional regulator [Kaistia dalseonensis]